MEFGARYLLLGGMVTEGMQLIKPAPGVTMGMFSELYVYDPVTNAFTIAFHEVYHTFFSFIGRFM